MKSFYLAIPLFFIVIGNVNSQSTEDLVTNIRRQYNEVTAMENNSAACQKGSRTNLENNIKFPQSSKKCNYSSGYSIITSKFEGWEWGATAKYYFKNGSIFFAYVNYYNVCGQKDFRIYYNNGRVIRALEKVDDCTDKPQNKNLTVTDRAELNWLIDWNKKRLNESYLMLGSL